MKKVLTLLSASALLLSLTGCSDAYTKISNGSDVLITDGTTSYTAEDFYDQAYASLGASTCLDLITKHIIDKEVELTDELKEKVEDKVKEIEKIFDDQEEFLEYLTKNGFESIDDYKEKNIIPSLLQEELYKKYVTENFDSLVTTYKPVQAQILTFTKESVAENALKMLEEGKTFEEVAKEKESSTKGEKTIYTSSSTLDKLVRSAITEIEANTLYDKVVKGSDDKFYVVKVIENDATKIKDDVITSLYQISNVQSKALTHFMRKYNFEVFDKIIYDAISASNNSLLTDSE